MIPAQDDPRIKVVRAEPNGGAPAARNIGIEAAEGEWIAAIDSDDPIEPECFDTLVRFARDTGADIVADDLLKSELRMS